ncbi:MAG: glycoside hydrolase family 57 protein [Candidatus Pacearchaeota archaeon]
MVSVCFYFQLHQPYRIRHYRVFDIGKENNYFDDEKNKKILEKVTRKCYIPATKKFVELLKRYPQFKLSFSFSGVLLEQLESQFPEVISLFKEALKTKRVEILGETYYHSLAFLYSKKEFDAQLKLHEKKIRKLFGVKPKVFRNTELIYNNELAKHIENLGYEGIITEGTEKILGWRSPNFVYKPIGTQKIKVLLKNYQLSDDIAFRFSSRDWKEWPLTAEKFANWISKINGNGTHVNLFMDYETFGEHQWEDTGIFDFITRLPEEILKHSDNNFKTPSEIIKDYNAVGEIDCPYFISWADVERDLTAWKGNPMQESALKKLYSLENNVLKTRNKKLIEDWRKLTTSDHFYYMCIKWFNDGDVHKYFSPYESPYDAFISFMNILEDIEFRVRELSKKKK